MPNVDAEPDVDADTDANADADADPKPNVDAEPDVDADVDAKYYANMDDQSDSDAYSSAIWVARCGDRCIVYDGIAAQRNDGDVGFQSRRTSITAAMECWNAFQGY
jgi:hypothetical protein